MLRFRNDEIEYKPTLYPMRSNVTHTDWQQWCRRCRYTKTQCVVHTCCQRLTASRSNRIKIQFDSISSDAKYQQQDTIFERNYHPVLYYVVRILPVLQQSNVVQWAQFTCDSISIVWFIVYCTRWIFVWRTRSTSLSPFHVLFLSVWLLSKLLSFAFTTHIH